MATRTLARTRGEVRQSEAMQGRPSPSPALASGSASSSLRAMPRTPGDVQRHALAGGNGEDCITVQLLIDGSDADGVRQFDESLPVSVVRAILDPAVADFFVPIAGYARPKARAAKQHFLHTSYIREVILLGDLPEEEYS